MTDSETLYEFDIIRRYFQKPGQKPGNHPNIVKGIGDDCAILSIPAGHELVISMDTLVVDRHFPRNLQPNEIAQRAFCVCLSDLAAMGAQPVCFTLSLTLPKADGVWLDTFSSALLAIADVYQCPLVGGNTTQGPLVITLQVHGLVKSGLALTRDGAKAGDKLYVTGALGDGRAALSLLTQSASAGVASTNYLRERFIRPEPQIKAGRLLSGNCYAAIDISDGLLADLHHLAQASQVDIEVNLDALPISQACREVAGTQVMSFALTGGDDYQLAFTLPEMSRQKTNGEVLELLHQSSITATDIGQIIPKENQNPTVHCIQNGQRICWKKEKGYQHFAS